MSDVRESSVLTPAMPLPGPPTYSGAVWIGVIEDDDPVLAGSGRLELEDAVGYDSCRLLVRTGDRSRGFVEAPVVAGGVDARQLADRVDALPYAIREGDDRTVTTPVPLTVTISTRDRAEQLATVLDSLIAMDVEAVSFLIVDNASADDATEKTVAALDDTRFRYVREDRPGLSYGRNLALLEASTPLLAFTDDDVVVDPQWIHALRAAFEQSDGAQSDSARSGDVALVTGMVPTGELRTPAQQYFEQQTGWQRGLQPRVFRLAQVPADIRAFPLDMSRYGTGANFAVRRDVIIRLGGFNEALGIGSPTHGGEDLDMFLRVLYAGWALAYTPDAVVWHRHRADATDLEVAVHGYSLSFTAWMASLLENPATRRDALRIGSQHVGRRIRELAAARATPSIGVVDRPGFDLAENGFAHLAAIGRRGLLAGPSAYVRSRRSGRRTRPLLGSRLTVDS